MVKPLPKGEQTFVNQFAQHGKLDYTGCLTNPFEILERQRQRQTSEKKEKEPVYS